MAAKDAKPAGSRFSAAESDRYSAIQFLACKYYKSEVNGGWLACVGRATREIDDRG